MRTTANKRIQIVRFIPNSLPPNLRQPKKAADFFNGNTKPRLTRKASENTKKVTPRLPCYNETMHRSLVGLLLITVAVLFALPGLWAEEIPVPTDLREHILYQVVVSRFADGDPANNFYNRQVIARGDPHWRGDFKGLVENLPYLKELGVTALIITPPVENRGSLDFEGDFPYDWTAIDPRLESTGFSFPEFIRMAHEQGFRVIQEVTVNHSSFYGIRHQVFIDRLPMKYALKTGEVIPWPYELNWGNYRLPFREDNDNPRAPLWFQDKVIADPFGRIGVNDPLTGVHVPSPDYNAARFYGTDLTRLPTDWYHRDGFMSAAETVLWPVSQRKSIHTEAIDLATENATVRNYLVRALYTYIDWGVDGFLISHGKHVSRDDLLPLVSFLKERNPRLFILADVATTGTGFGELSDEPASARLKPWWYSRTGHDPRNPDSGFDSGLAVLDYPLFTKMIDTTAQGHFTGLGSLLTMDWAYGDPTRLVTFFQQRNIGPSGSFSHRFAGTTVQAILTYNLLWTIRGIPSILYGEECEFQKGGLLKLSSAVAPLSTTGKAYFGDRLASGTLAETKQNPVFLHLQRLNKIRRAIPALQTGRLTKGQEWGIGMSFVREDQQKLSLAVVGLAARTDQEITVSSLPNGIYTDAITGGVASISTNVLSFTVKANSIGIWVKNGPGGIGTNTEYLR